jgi:UDP-N-acetylmuramate dehydrogenase
MFQKNISLKPFNTFGIEARAEMFAEVNRVDQLQEIIRKHKNLFILSGGSNILLTRNITRPVVKIGLRGREILGPSEDERTLVKVQAGENWHDFVMWCIARDLGGLENLSLIPGLVGTSPMQNIGAYGVEIKDVFYELEALEIGSGERVKFSAEDCRFAYRESVFKNELKGKYVIINVTFALTSKDHRIVTDYGAIRSELSKRGIEKPGIKDVSDVVIAIRRSKLPDPKELGNSGSFFKNPVIEREHFEKLLKKYPSMPYYEVDQRAVKVPAGWLVETSGFKGKRFGDAGVHARQALVLVNYGDATGREVLDLAERIRHEVARLFDIRLEMEVNVI